MPRELTSEECHELAEAFAAAARRAVAAGFDVISIHGGHGYLVHQFMSPRTNSRADQFGASEAFPNLVIDAVRAAVPDALVGIRVSMVEGCEGGLDAEQTLDVVSRLHLDALDFLDLSAGSYEAGEWIVQSGEWKPGILADYARPYRRFGLPLGLAGRLNSPEAIERVLVEDACDFVSLGRAVHADPGFVRGVLEGKRYRPCIACNVCIDNLGLGQVTCTVNPAVGRSRTPVPTPGVPCRVVVVGGGPAGLTAGRELALAGARVTLLDAASRLGGQFRLAARMKSTPDFHRFLDWSHSELERLGVEIRLGTTIGLGRLGELARAEDADAIVLATGGTLPEPGFRASGRAAEDGVIDVRTWLADRPGLVENGDVPEAVTLWGADSVALSVADTLASLGTRVLLVGPEPVLAPESGRRAKILAAPRLEANPNVRIVVDSRIVEADASRLRVSGPDGEQWLDAPGPILVSRGIVPLNASVDREGREAALSVGAGVPVALAGTVIEQLPATASNAIKSGYDAAQRLAARLARQVPSHAPFEEALA
jgi:thioredoxin reductase